MVEYVSRDQVLIDFKKNNEGNALILQSLEEVGDNPFGATLNIKAKDPSQYASIAQFLEQDSALAAGASSIVDRLNYHQNKEIIDNLSTIIASTQTLGFALTLIFVIMSVTVTMGTVRLAIYTARDEISVMRLVGASNNYVRGPFIVEGLMYGVLSALIVIVLFYPISLWVADVTHNFFGGLDLLAHYRSKFLELLLVLIVTGSVLGVGASYVAVHRYLKAQ